MGSSEPRERARITPLGTRRGQIVYVSFDGLLQPLGWAQVAQPVMRLARRGYRYQIVSLERSHDLAKREVVSRVRDQLLDAGVAWDPQAYASSGTRSSVAHNLRATFAATRRAVRAQSTALLHARSYPAALVADAVRSTEGTDYIFDTRGYWIDERRDEGRWFTRPALYRGGKLLERRLFARCVAAVNLTDLATTDVRKGQFGPWPADKSAVTIPTCADYAAFQLPKSKTAARARILPSLTERLLIGYVGSINASYLVPEAFDLFGRMLRRRPDAHLLCATHQSDEARAIATAAGIPTSAITVQSFAHEQMPALLAALDWGLLLLAERFSKRASMPTKLAEFFATGVRPIAYGCNEEVSGWVDRAGTGFVLPDTGEASLNAAAERIATSQCTERTLREGRERTREHFDLQGGVDRYDHLLSALICRD